MEEDDRKIDTERDRERIVLVEKGNMKRIAGISQMYDFHYAENVIKVEKSGRTNRATQ